MDFQIKEQSVKREQTKISADGEMIYINFLEEDIICNRWNEEETSDIEEDSFEEKPKIKKEISSENVGSCKNIVAKDENETQGYPILDNFVEVPMLKLEEIEIKEECFNTENSIECEVNTPELHCQSSSRISKLTKISSSSKLHKNKSIRDTINVTREDSNDTSSKDTCRIKQPPGKKKKTVMADDVIDLVSDDDDDVECRKTKRRKSDNEDKCGSNKASVMDLEETLPAFLIPQALPVTTSELRLSNTTTDTPHDQKIKSSSSNVNPVPTVHLLSDSDEEEPHKTNKNTTRNVKRESCLQCEVCHRNFAEEEELIKHCQFHARPEPFKCALCEMTFVTFHGLACHNKQNVLKCAKCNKHFTQELLVSFHKCLALPRTTVKTETKHDVASKPSTTHTRKEEETSMESDVFGCQDCARLFSDRGQLEQHSVFHLRPEKYKCGLCEMTFMNSHGLRCHVKLSRLRCDKCNKHFTRAPLLQFHNCIDGVRELTRAEREMVRMRYYYNAGDVCETQLDV